MKYAFKARDEVTDRVNGAPAPGGFMKSYTRDSLREMFFNEENCAMGYLHGSEKKEKDIAMGKLFQTGNVVCRKSLRRWREVD